jgi:hypothetical protein
MRLEDKLSSVLWLEVLFLLKIVVFGTSYYICWTLDETWNVEYMEVSKNKQTHK